jgi:two-component sensor histidine kinase
VTVTLWQLSPPPTGFTDLWRQELRSLSELARLRARLRTELTGRAVVEHPEREHWSERLVLIVDELASNALRHGRSPVDALLARRDDEWLISVADRSSEPPVPAQGRDPARGGFGLYLVADLAARHGWCAERSAKTVWATVRATGDGA